MTTARTALPLTSASGSSATCGSDSHSDPTACKTQVGGPSGYHLRGEGGQTQPITQLFRRVNYVTLKLTPGCNLSCTYCNVEAETPRTPRMSIDTYRRIADLLIGSSTADEVTLEFHGGEPLLLPDSWFTEAVAYGRSMAHKYKKSITFPLVTNGTMLTPERLAHLEGLGIEFCISMDGPPELNDRVRGGGHAVERALRMLLERDQPLGVMTVISKLNCNRMSEVMDYFSGLGVRAFRTNFVEPQGRGNDAELMISTDEMFESLRQAFHHMARTKVSVEEGEVLMYVQRYLRGRGPAGQIGCWDFECQAARSYVAIDHTGTVHACGTDLRNHVLGHINHDLDVSHYETTVRRLHDKGTWVLRCFDCAAAQICRHSCATSMHNSQVYRENECAFTKKFYDYLGRHHREAAAIQQEIDTRRRRRDAAFIPPELIRLRSKDSPT